jgi:DnaJ domain
MAVDHYGMLGVEPTAAPAEVRQAYLRRARALHPDHYADASHEEQRRAEQAMQQVNEAWRVLGHAERRAAYDRARGVGSRAVGPTPSGPAPPRPSYRTVEDVARQAHDEAATRPRLVRAWPWIALAGVAIGIFVFTAFAGGTADAPSDEGTTGVCVTVDPVNGAVAEADCAGPNDGLIEVSLAETRVCPTGTRRVPLPGEPRVLCLVDAPGPAE